MDFKQLIDRAKGQVSNPDGTQSVKAFRRYLAVGALVVALAVIGGACGSSSSSSSATGVSSSTTTHAKTKFALHAGLAFGAFHRWIYKPLRAGTLQHPLSHKLVATKAALAGGFTYHELRLALQNAQADPTLSKLVAPITALQNRINGVTSGLKSGHVDTSQIQDTNGSIASIHQQSASAGQPITEQTPSSP